MDRGRYTNTSLSDQLSRNNERNRRKDQKKRNYKKAPKRPKNNNMLLNASAFQDHITQQMGINLGVSMNSSVYRKKKLTERQRKERLRKQIRENVFSLNNEIGTNNNNNNNNNNEENLKSEEEESQYLSWNMDNRWTCNSCTLLNRGESSRCAACLRPRNRNQSHQRNKHSSAPGEADFIRPMTLAERRGLVPLPDRILTREQWKDVEIKTWKRLIRKARFGYHKDEQPVCAICLEGYKNGTQILLSCSHIFHQNCIASFERFLRSNDRACPLCRKPEYQKKKTRMGTIAYKHYSATKIQSIWRLYYAKKNYYQYLKDLYANGGGDPGCRRRFLLNEMVMLNNKIQKNMERKEETIDMLFSTFDKSIESSRKILTESSYQYLSGRSDAQNEIIKSLYNTNETFVIDDFWRDIIETARSRSNPDCPICMSEFHHHKSKPKNQIITSCTHVFHKNCLEAFENFKGDEIPYCPVCRSLYTKLTFEVYENHNTINGNNENVSETEENPKENEDDELTNDDDEILDEDELASEVIQSIPYWSNLQFEEEN